MCIPQSFVAFCPFQHRTIQFECLKMNGSMRLSERFTTFCCKSIQSTPEQIWIIHVYISKKKTKNLFPMSIKKDAHNYLQWFDHFFSASIQVRFFSLFPFACWFIHSFVHYPFVLDFFTSSGFYVFRLNNPEPNQIKPLMLLWEYLLFSLALVCGSFEPVLSEHHFL